MSTVTCPKCKGHSVTIISNEANMKSHTSLNLNPLKPFTVFNHTKKAKVSKGKVALGLMTGGASLIATGTKHTKHLDVLCNDCGNRFTAK